MVFDPVKDAEYMRTSKLDKGLEVVLESILDDKPENGPASFCSLMMQWAIGMGAFDKTGSMQDILRTVTEMLQSRNHVFSCEEKDQVRKIKGTLSPKHSVTSSAAWRAEDNEQMMAKKVVRRMKLTNALTKQVGPASTMGLSETPNAAKLLLDICLNISAQQVDHAKLIKSLIQGASSLLQADRCTFFLVEGDELVSKIAEGTGEIRLPIGHGIAGTVAQTGSVINIADAYSDPRFNQNVDRKTGYKTQNLICAPIFYEDSVIAVAQLLNKQNGSFTTADVSLFEVFSSFAGVFLANSYHYHEVTREKRKNEILLDVVQRVNATDLSSWEEVAEVIRDGCKKLLLAERCTLYLLDKEAGLLSGSDGTTTFQLPMNQGIAGFVCNSGETVNIPDAYCDPRFNPDIDANTGFVTKSILCMPIVTNKEIVAVAQVINKSNKGEFVEDDEELLQFFTAFSGLHLWNAKLLEFCTVSRESAMRLLTSQNGDVPEDAKQGKDSYGITIASEAAAAASLAVPVQPEELSSVITPDFNVHLYSLKSDSYPKIIRLAIHLFDTMGHLTMFGISKEKMARFLLTIQSKYRAVPYHNFVHAFDVLQSIFVYLYCYNVRALISEKDAFALLVTALVHDVDHMGLNNSFHSKSETPLGLLSSASGASSVLEVHHCNVAIAVLSIPGTNIFSYFSKDDSVQVYKVMIHNVLHTDMAKHSEILGSYKALSRQEYNKEDPAHRQLICAILLKCADLSNLTKPFNISRLWAIAITTEFYLQGDSERAEGKAITPGFDRTTKQELAKAQLGFLNHVGLNFFSTVAEGVLQELEPVLVNLKSNAAKWAAILSCGS